MKILKEVLILSLIATVVLCTLNIAAASSMSTLQPRSGSSGYSIKILGLSYQGGKQPYGDPNNPLIVPITLNFDLIGRVMKDNKGLNNVIVYHGEIVQNVPNPTFWYVKTTDENGTFTDNFQFHDPGRHDLIYTYMWGPGTADFCQSPVVSIYAVQNA